ncbi:MAG: dUTP diphosphatase [Rhodospirillaceae bacterium]|nr:dUTP diphosphatase [Rhodospirillaceae bacterium]OUT77339.1 MAG: deoxyuridine 5'-triphosphate nucleotidohydrolase [Rhodospirillaceae bacterium TMED23]|tara:strand:+ start:1871 stop:2323 length:453 start_codon:yes stop_codon:yes gene_type:complete
MEKISVSIKRLKNYQGLPLPEIQTNFSAGVDLLAAVNNTLVIKPSQRKIVPTGISIALPEGYEAQVRPRSGLAIKNGISVLNTPGTIDSDYRGEIGVILINFGNNTFKIERGMRIAQMVVSPVVAIAWNETDELSKTTRGSGGFGSTGTK